MSFRNDNSPMMRICAGAPGLLAAVLAWLVMELLSMGRGASESFCSGGTLVSDTSLWPVPFALSCAAEMALTAICALGLWLLNKHYNFMPGPGCLFSSLTLVGCGAFSAASPGLGGGIFVAAAALACTAILFSVYGRRNASTPSFLLFTILSWGSMIQSACVMLMLVFLLGLSFMGAGRIREYAAALLGIAAPYWIVLTLSPAAANSLLLRMPYNITHLQGSTHMMLFILIGAGLCALVMIMLMLYNALHILSTGVMMRSFLAFINLLGCATVWFMLFDSAQLGAYIPLLVICLALTVTRSFQLSPSPRAWILPVSVAAMYIVIFTLFA